MKRPLSLAAAILLGIAAFFFLREKNPPAPATVAPASTAHPSVSSAASSPSSNSKSQIPAPSDISPIARDLNSPRTDITRDLATVAELLVAWQTNYPHDGNPVGDNADLVRALTGDNKFALVLLDPRHPAINARGELCDRWGTPFFFHAESGTRMTIESAGPDKKRHTPDDESFTP